MKMDPSCRPSQNGSGSVESGGGGGGGKENVFSGIYESAHFANIFVEFENDTREMAIDVPDHFVATTKTPPKYPPPFGTGTLKGHSMSYFGCEDGGGVGTQSRSSSLSLSNGHTPLRTSSSSTAPMPCSRQHLKIEADGRLIVNGNPPPPVPEHRFTATPEEKRRMQKYGEGLAKRAAEEEKRAQQEDFLRHSIRNSQKMRALKESSLAGAGHHSPSSGNVNAAFSAESSLRSDPSTSSVQMSLSSYSATGLLALLDRVRDNQDLNAILPDAASGLSRLTSLFADTRFQESLIFAQKVEKSLGSHSGSVASFDIQETTEDCINYLGTMDRDGDAEELRKLLSRNWIESLLYAHDKIASRRVSPMDGSDALLERLSHYAEPNIKIVRIEKSLEPLGATVKNQDDAVVVGRIIRGGTAEASGLLHEGDELLEVNEIELRGKDVNEVCDVLANMNGTLTFLVVPTRHHLSSPAEKKFPVVHVKAHIDYDPEDDPYVPCRELGISFQKGDILHVVNQRDAYWWQARRDGEEDQTLPGLIPSAHFLQQREAMKNTIAMDVNGKDGGKRWNHHSTSGFLCAKKPARSKKRKVFSALDDDPDGESIVTYEEVALYYPRAEHKRPIVLIGPPNIGRHELRQRLMLDQDRFAAAIPHTSRPKRANEVDGQDYHFITRLQFEQDILARRFVEHGEYEKAYYGTSLEAISNVVRSEKICVLNLHPQSLKMLKSSKLMPYVVFVAPPSLEKLKRIKMDHSEAINDDELKDIIERAREMEEVYGHYFDMFITYNDPERAYQLLLSAINALEREPQWVPATWLLNGPGP